MNWVFPMNAKRQSRRLATEKVCELVLDLVDHIDAMVAYWDSHQVCVFANNAYLDWFGKTKAEMIGLTLAELLGPIYPLNLPYIRAAYAGERQVFEREIPSPDGRRIRHSLATYIPHVVGGKVRGIFVHVSDVTPLKEMEKELRAAKAQAEKLAVHDFLTGLPNRVLLEDRIRQALALARRRHKRVALLSLDIDDFKKINDTWGHSAGDRLLIELASRLKGSLRESDEVTRWGGDEFLVLAPMVGSAAELETMADRLLNQVRQPFQIGETMVSPTVSLGIALYPEHGKTAGELMESADRALYTAKERGKDRYAFTARAVPGRRKPVPAGGAEAALRTRARKP